MNRRSQGLWSRLGSNSIPRLILEQYCRSQAVCRASFPETLSDIRWNGYSSPSHLRGQREDFVTRKLGSELVTIQNELMGFSPNN